MICRAIPLLLMLAGCALAPPEPRGGGGIVSTNPCADAILLALVPPRRIAAISRYSQDPAASSIPLGLANSFRSTAGTAEEVIALRPSLVLASSFTPAATRRAYDRAGLKVLLLDSPTSIAASEAQVMQVAGAVGEAAKGRVLVAAIARSSFPMRAKSDRKGDIPALLFIGGDLANGSGTLLDEMMRRAGLRNAAAEYGVAFTGPLPIETIARHPPAVVIAPEDGRSARLRRQVLAATGARVVRAHLPRRLINCGGPVIPGAMARLRAIRATLS